MIDVSTVRSVGGGRSYIWPRETYQSVNPSTWKGVRGNGAGGLQ
jgi:hypothetical protein